MNCERHISLDPREPSTHLVTTTREATASPIFYVNIFNEQHNYTVTSYMTNTSFIN